jgi:2,3-bisphosphoglycerate-independent phosphoglycerate mutase
MKGVFVIIDGVADLPSNILKGMTPLQVAKTPNLDSIAQKSKINYAYPIKEGIAPESSSAVVSLLGYDPNFAPRGPLEAMGAGVRIKKGDLVMRCNFATIQDMESGEILDSRAGRTLTNKEAHILAKAINEKVKLPYKFEFIPTRGHRGVLIFRGGFSDNISNADPFYGIGFAKTNVVPKMVFSKPLDDEDDSKLSAELVNQFIRESHKVLNHHPVNLNRAKKGLYSANVLLCRDAGNEAVKFKKLKGKWMALGYNPLEIGIANAAGMDVYSFKYPKFKGIDVYEHLHYGLKKAIKYAIKMLKRKRDKYDYFYVHLKETDLPGHDNKPLDKVKMIEMIDSKFFSFLKDYIGDSKLIVTADHTTACKLKAHTDDPVPVLIYPSNSENKENRFIEEEGRKGKKIIGRKLLEQYLFNK